MVGNPTFFALMLPGCDHPALSNHSHAMPSGLNGEVGVSFKPRRFFVAIGVSVPISRGRPPALFVQA